MNVFCADVVPDLADAHDLVLTLLEELRGINLDHPDTQRHMEEIERNFDEAGRRAS